MSRGIALLFLGPRHWMGWGVSPTPWPPLPPGKTRYPCTGGWVGPRAGLAGWKISPLPGFDPGPCYQAHNGIVTMCKYETCAFTYAHFMCISLCVWGGGHCSEPLHLLIDCHKIIFLACFFVNVMTLKFLVQLLWSEFCCGEMESRVIYW